jgi:hypothetical protein
MPSSSGDREAVLVRGGSKDSASIAAGALFVASSLALAASKGPEAPNG